MSYSSISVMVGAVALILGGGFAAIILIDILFNWFDDIRAWFIAQQDKEQGVTRVTCSEAEHVRIDRETERELRRLAGWVPTEKSDRPLAGEQARPRGVSRPLSAADGMDHATAQLTPYPRQAAKWMDGCGCLYCAAARACARGVALASGRGPGRGDPPKGVAH